MAETLTETDKGRILTLERKQAHHKEYIDDLRKKIESLEGKVAALERRSYKPQVG